MVKGGGRFDKQLYVGSTTDSTSTTSGSGIFKGGVGVGDRVYVGSDADTDKDGGISRREFSKWVGGVAEQRMAQEEKTLRALVDARLRCEAPVAAAMARRCRRVNRGAGSVMREP